MVYDFLLIRGLSRSTEHWHDFPDRLLKAEGVNSVHFVDLPGNGEYHKLTSPLTVREMAEFVRSHDPIPKENKKVLLAVSLGAMVAIELVALYDEAYQAAFLMNTSIAGLSPVQQRLTPFALEKFYHIMRAKKGRDREFHALELVSNFPEKREKVIEAWTQIAHSRPTSVSNSFRQLIAAGSYRLPKIKPRTPLFLMASKADRMVSYQCSMNLAAKWNLPVAIHTEAGHELALDAPDWVCKNIQEWVATLV